MRRYTLFLPKEQIKILKDVQVQSGITPSEQIRRAVGEYLSKVKPLAITSPSKNAKSIDEEK